MTIGGQAAAEVGVVQPATSTGSSPAAVRAAMAARNGSSMREESLSCFMQATYRRGVTDSREGGTEGWRATSGQPAIGWADWSAQAGQISWKEHQVHNRPGRGGKRCSLMARSMADHSARS